MTGGLTIGNIAKRFGISQRTIRYYEELGLISSERSHGGFRVFNDLQMEKLHAVLILKELGMSLEEVGEFMKLRHSGITGSETAPPLIEKMKTKIGDFKKAVEKYKLAIKELERVINLVEDCEDCSSKPEETACEACFEDRTHHHVTPLMKALL